MPGFSINLGLEVMAVVRGGISKPGFPEGSAHGSLLGGGHTGLEQPGCAERRFSELLAKALT